MANQLINIKTSCSMDNIPLLYWLIIPNLLLLLFLDNKYVISSG